MEPTRANWRPGRAAVLPLAVVCAAAAACAGPEDDGAAAPATTCPIATAPAAPTFRGDVLPMLRSTCGAGSATACHGAPAPAGHVSYSPALAADEIHAQLAGAEPSNAPPGEGWLRVAPGDPARSWLVEKITKDDPGGAGRAHGNRMPYGLPNLCEPTVTTVVRWIERGASND